MHRNQQSQGWNSVGFAKFLKAVHTSVVKNINAVPGILEDVMVEVRDHIKKTAFKEELEKQEKVDAAAQNVDEKPMEEDDHVSVDGYGEL